MYLTQTEAEQLYRAKCGLEEALTGAYAQFESILSRIPREALSIQMCFSAAEAMAGVQQEARFAEIKEVLWRVIADSPLCEHAELILKSCPFRVWPRLKVDQRLVYLGWIKPPTTGQQLVVRTKLSGETHLTVQDQRFLKSLRIRADE